MCYESLVPKKKSADQSPAGVPPRRISLLGQLEASREEDLIVRWKDRESDGTLADGYAEAARRLAATFQAQATDDKILLPFLFLYRHAFELDLKHAIREAVQVRRMARHAELADSDELEAKLKKWGHRLQVLSDVLDEHLRALGLEETPPSVRRVVLGLGRLDLGGTGFRYAGVLDDDASHIDFPKLSAQLEATHRVLEACDSMLDYHADAYRCAAEEMAQQGAALRRGGACTRPHDARTLDLALPAP